VSDKTVEIITVTGQYDKFKHFTKPESISFFHGREENARPRIFRMNISITMY
jgi:hypothetical protein